MKILIYDCEIIKAIRDPKKVDLAHTEYCNGWEKYGYKCYLCK